MTLTTTGPTGPTGPATGPSSVIAVHPRIRSRRMEVLRDAGRRRLKRGVVVLSVAVALLAVAALVRSPALDVDHLRAGGGGEHTPRADVLAAAGVDHGAAMVGLDTRAAERRVEALPWVAEATVTRNWPGTVTVTVEERTAVASVPIADTRWARVDGSGRVLAVDEAPPGGLPALRGVAGRIAAGEPVPADARDALTLLSAVDEALPGGVAEVTTGLDVTLAYGGQVRFGSVDDLDDKVVALETVLGRVDLACMALLDLRAPSAPALTRHEACS